ncbi:hypothetical protein [Embleya hyalina]|uniref:Pycsar effector protein domain-containing protein n=1 Tax=Embleya hyalina TaxID=516124 RepID=A0A401Z3Z4_9ACTN|nr:hypothetical protein [Embleya hyalina]GCE01573.1 hypothetical protein EHYA_09339 [Embleya hyalina]
MTDTITPATASVAALHRHIDDLIANIRAADAKASLVLVGVGVGAGALDRLPTTAAWVAAAGLAATATLLGLVLLPRVAGWLDDDPDPDTILRRIADADHPRALATHYATLRVLVHRKYRLIRGALLTLAATVAATAPLTVATTR